MLFGPIQALPGNLSVGKYRYLDGSCFAAYGGAFREAVGSHLPPPPGINRGKVPVP